MLLRLSISCGDALRIFESEVVASPEDAERAMQAAADNFLRTFRQEIAAAQGGEVRRKAGRAERLRPENRPPPCQPLTSERSERV
jgi:hypothetical protein